MNNTLKILDDAIQATLIKHPEEMFRSSVALGLSRKIQKQSPESYAKTFTSMNFARQKILELNPEKAKEEVIKNAIKVVCLLARKKCKMAVENKQLEAENYVVGEAACGKLVYGLQHGKTMTEIIEDNPDMLNVLCENFVYTRHVKNDTITKEELDSNENLKYCEKYFKLIGQFC